MKHNDEMFKLEAGTKLLMYNSIKDYNGTAATANGVRAAWDAIMQKYECCGIESKPNEFNSSKWYRSFKPPDPFPAACCETPSPWSPDTYCLAANRRGLGCHQALTEVLESQLVIVISVGAAVGLIQVKFKACLRSVLLTAKL
ncbi:unnamed protein product [Soboliphyme baturini]|uniref:SCP domain-containing protein n=1 Tax=Soboliphyme baturini TaxID=241478 RepID=A0A183IZ52_9BILA|nr:unnamed protein product [Soboliphyme baturini]